MSHARCFEQRDEFGMNNRDIVDSNFSTTATIYQSDRDHTFTIGQALSDNGRKA
jgi:hypothetical protein